MAIAGNVTLKLSSTTAEFSKGLKQAAKESESFVDTLKTQFGRRSELTEFTHLLGGTGAIFGLNLVTRDFAEAAKKMSELGDVFKDDSKNAADLAIEVGKSLPIIGNIVEAGSSLNNLFTGEADEIKGVNEEAEELTKHIKEHQEFAEKTGKIFEGWAEAIRRANQALGSEGKPTDEQQRLAIGDKFDNEKAALDRQFKKDSEEIAGPGGKGLADLIVKRDHFKIPEAIGRMLPNDPQAKDHAYDKREAERSKAKSDLADLNRTIKEKQEAMAKLNAGYATRFGQLQQSTEADIQKYLKDHAERIKNIDADLNKIMPDGVTPEKIRGSDQSIREFFEEIEADARTHAEQMKNGLMTPMESYQKQLDDLKNSAGAGLIDQQTLDRGRSKAYDDYINSKNMIPPIDPEWSKPGSPLFQGGSDINHPLIPNFRFNDDFSSSSVAPKLDKLQQLTQEQTAVLKSMSRPGLDAAISIISAIL